MVGVDALEVLGEEPHRDPGQEEDCVQALALVHETPDVLEDLLRPHPGPRQL